MVPIVRHRFQRQHKASTWSRFVVHLLNGIHCHYGNTDGWNTRRTNITTELVHLTHLSCNFLDRDFVSFRWYNPSVSLASRKFNGCHMLINLSLRLDTCHNIFNKHTWIEYRTCYMYPKVTMSLYATQHLNSISQVHMLRWTFKKIPLHQNLVRYLRT